MPSDPIVYLPHQTKKPLEKAPTAYFQGLSQSIFFPAVLHIDLH